MLAPAQLPERFSAWNARWSAPFGGRRRKATPRFLRQTRLGIRMSGPFAFQPNSDTRVFEYPWAFEALALDLEPFTASVANVYGTNISVRWLVEQSGMVLVHGDRSELYGYPEFDPARILARKGQYRVGGGWPVMVQSLVLRKA